MTTALILPCSYHGAWLVGYEPGKQFAFAYDGIGNRTSSSVSSIASTTTLRTTGYSANALNQYDSITHPQPGWLVLRGSANTAAGTTVTIDGNASTLTTGTLWFYEQSVDNTEGPVRREVEITATRPDGGVNNGPVTTQQQGALFIPPPTEVPTYDLDGNLTSDARWNYVWNGENRLVAEEEKTGFIVQPTSSAPIKRTRLEFDYDAEGRRIGKRTFIATGSGGFVLQQTLVHLYDGWNMIAEIDTTSSAQLLRSYEWGTDVSGTMTGAGGVGGLVAERFYTTPAPDTYSPCYDGNGNVTELVSFTTGNVRARYEYGAFGETISVDGGAVAEMNPFRFSTKHRDEATGQYYYGFRYYSPEMGRWLNKDPLEERGGRNLLAFLQNNSLNSMDNLGLQDTNKISNTNIKSGALDIQKKYQIIYKGKNIGSIEVTKYNMSPRSVGQTLMIVGDVIGMTAEFRSILTDSNLKQSGICFLRWRQRLTYTNKKGDFKEVKGQAANNLLDPIPNSDDKEWYYTNKERETWSTDGVSETFSDNPRDHRDLYQPGDEKVICAFTTELVKVPNLSQKDGGEVLLPLNGASGLH